jgi:hypothetical protein
MGEGEIAEFVEDDEVEARENLIAILAPHIRHVPLDSAIGVELIARFFDVGDEVLRFKLISYLVPVQTPCAGPKSLRVNSSILMKDDSPISPTDDSVGKIAELNLVCHGCRGVRGKKGKGNEKPKGPEVFLSHGKPPL